MLVVMHAPDGRIVFDDLDQGLPFRNFTNTRDNPVVIVRQFRQILSNTQINGGYFVAACHKGFGKSQTDEPRRAGYKYMFQSISNRRPQLFECQSIGQSVPGCYPPIVNMS